TLAPWPAAMRAARTPPDPPPITKRSTCLFIANSSLWPGPMAGAALREYRVSGMLPGACAARPGGRACRCPARAARASVADPHGLDVHRDDVLSQRGRRIGRIARRPSRIVFGGFGARGGGDRKQPVGEQDLAGRPERFGGEPDEPVLQPPHGGVAFGDLRDAQGKLPVGGEANRHDARHARSLLVVPIMIGSHTPQVTSTPLACASFIISISGHVRWPRETYLFGSSALSCGSSLSGGGGGSCRTARSSASIAAGICSTVMIPVGPGVLPMISSSRSATDCVIVTVPVRRDLNS